MIDIHVVWVPLITRVPVLKVDGHIIAVLAKRARICIDIHVVVMIFQYVLLPLTHYCTTS